MTNERTKNVLLAVLVVGLVTMTIAYALLSQRLNINSSAVVKKASQSWNVHFTSPDCTASNYAEVTTPLALNGTTTLDSLVATFKAPGDSVTCTFNVENTGTINAKITDYAKQDATKTITYTGSGANKTADEAKVNGKILYDLVYYGNTGDNASINGSEPAVNDTLAASETKKLKLTLTFDSNATELPTNDVTISNFSTYMIYGQN